MEKKQSAISGALYLSQDPNISKNGNEYWKGVCYDNNTNKKYYLSIFAKEKDGQKYYTFIGDEPRQQSSNGGNEINLSDIPF